MSTALDIRAGATAKRLIEKFGKPMLLKRIYAVPYDPATGKAGTVPAIYAVTGVITTPSANTLMPGSLVTAGDRFVLIAGQSLLQAGEPGDSDVLEIDGVDWEIINIQPIYSGEDVAIYSLLVR